MQCSIVFWLQHIKSEQLNDYLCQKFTTNSLAPHVTRFEASQGPRMGQTQLYSSLAFRFVYYTTEVHGIIGETYVILGRYGFGNQNTQVISFLKDGLTLKIKK